MGKSNSREKQQDLANRFLVFWEAYPKRRDKITAQRAWRRIAPSSDDLFAILQGINRYMASGEWKDPQFIPYPATFLNGRRWEDEIGRGAHEVETPQPRYCAICGHTGSWHLNETKHGRAPDHQFVESIMMAS